MKDKLVLKHFIAIIAISILSYRLDHMTVPAGQYKECNRFIPQGIHLFHHIMMTWLCLAWLSNSYYILMGAIIGWLVIFVHHATNKGKCVLSQYYIRSCNLPEDTELRKGLEMVYDNGKTNRYVYYGVTAALFIATASRLYYTRRIGLW